MVLEARVRLNGRAGKLEIELMAEKKELAGRVAKHRVGLAKHGFRFCSLRLASLTFSVIDFESVRGDKMFGI
jgi:hypothetical protein